MLQTTAAILAAAASAGLIVAFVPGSKPATGTQQAPIDRSRWNDGRIGTSVDLLQNSEADHQPGCVRSWPYYEPSCLRSGNPGNPRIIGVVVGDRSPAADAERARR